MDAKYDALFDLRDNLEDDNDKYYHQIIPTISINVYRKVLDKDLKIINKSTLSMQQWAKFKYNLLIDEKEWQVEIFKWTPFINPAYPYIGMDINWDQLEDKPSRYFQVHMALENVWMGDTRLANIWKRIDKTV